MRAKRPGERLVKPAAVATVFGVEISTVIDWAKSGKIRAIRTPGGQWRIFETAIEALVDDSLDEHAPELHGAL